MDNKLKSIIYRKSALIRENKTQIRHFLADQSGGGKKLSITYNDHKYIFEEAMDKNYYILYSKEEFDCVTVIIDKENNKAEIHGIGNYKSCLDDAIINVGSTLFKITLKMLQKYKDKFNLKKILLSDNSIKKCNNKDIKLPIMLTLLNGETWYGNYGFKPVEEKLIDYYENNKKIMNTVTLKDIDLIKYLKMTKLDKEIIEKTTKFIEKHESLLVKDYLTKFLKKYDKTCEYFYNFYEQLFIDLRLYDFHHRTFELNI